MPFASRPVVALLALLATANCSKSSDTPTSPTNPSVGTVYANVSASDATGYMSSVECFPFTTCAPNATGWVQTLFRRLEQNGTAALNNIGVPGQVLSQHFEDLGRRIGRTYPGNFITNQVPFVRADATVVTIFAGGNDANTIGQVIQAGQAGDDLRAFIDQQAQRFGEDVAALVRAIRQRAPNAKVVILNLPNLGGAPYMNRSSALDRGIMQRIAVSMTDRINAQAGPTTFVVDMMCDARILEPASFSSDGFHPSDRGYALMAEIAYPAVVNASHPAPAADCALRRVAPAY